MNTKLDSCNGPFDQPRAISTASTARRLPGRRRGFGAGRGPGRFLLASLLILMAGCLTPELEVDVDAFKQLTSNGITPEEVTENISVARPLIDSALLDEYGGLDQTAAGPLLATSGGQRFLRHAIACALGRDESVVNPGDGPGFFAGHLDLAPAWKERGLSASEKRALSACLLAHMNAFGVDVTISIRNHDLLGVESGEMVEYEFHEARFYGDLFAPVPAMFVCAGQPAPGANADGDRALRVCSDRSAPGSSRTLCGLELIGPCSEVCDTSAAGSRDDCWDSAAKNGAVYPESMSVWLSLDDPPDSP